jgi:tripartite-type tricarboxylate transporter receptor subunit TctC
MYQVSYVSYSNNSRSYKMKKILLVAGLVMFTVFAFGAGKSEAQAGSKLDWPKKAVQIVVPYGSGGDTDFKCSRIREIS